MSEAKRTERAGKIDTLNRHQNGSISTFDIQGLALVYQRVHSLPCQQQGTP